MAPGLAGDVHRRRRPRLPGTGGSAELRDRLAAHLARTRGLTCEAANVLVTAGTTHGLSLLLTATSAAAPARARAVAIEDPGYRAAVAVAQTAGFDVVDVPVDEAGLDVDALRDVPATTSRPST